MTAPNPGFKVHRAVLVLVNVPATVLMAGKAATSSIGILDRATPVGAGEVGERQYFAGLRDRHQTS